MKIFIPLGRILLFSCLFIFSSTQVNAQFLKKLGKRAEKAAERAVERRVDKEATEKTDQALDSILEPGAKGGQKSPVPTGDGPADGNSDNGQTSQPSTESTPSRSTGPKTLLVYSKFDFVPGDKQLFYEDFSNDFVGDFPSKWNTNGSGEVVIIGDSSDKWLELVSGYNVYFVPDVPKLPEEYTIEFDILSLGLDKKTSSTAILEITLSDDIKFKEGANFVQARIPLCQYSPIGVNIENRINNKREIYSTVKADLRDEVLDTPHISIAVNKQRFRLWVNEEKQIDVPRLVPEGSVLNALKYRINGTRDGTERIFLSHLKVAEGGIDLRRKLISEGKVSTNGILFDSGSDNIKAESMGIVRQIYQVLQQESAMKLKIVGHTDADGTDDINLKLSKDRAEAVKKALTTIYSVSEARLSTEGKGELEPVSDNSTADGKAQNRRVEFIKQ